MAIRAPRRLSASHRVDAFDSGAANLDFWLREQALASARTAATYVVSDEQDAVLGSDLLRDALLRSLASTQQVAACWCTHWTSGACSSTCAGASCPAAIIPAASCFRLPSDPVLTSGKRIHSVGDFLRGAPHRATCKAVLPLSFARKREQESECVQ